MPKKKPEPLPGDYLSTALESLKEHPQPQLGLEIEDRTPPLGYLDTVGAVSEDEAKSSRKRKPSGKTRMAFNLPHQLCERARNAVWHLSDVVCLNLSSLAERTLEREVVRLEKKYNDGKPFPRRKGRLKGGRLSGCARNRQAIHAKR